MATREWARVTLNFHPDRVMSDGRTVAEALRDEGIYRSQFETGISNGGLTAFPGGDRDEWERRLFDGAYHAPSTAAASEARVEATTRAVKFEALKPLSIITVK